MNMSELNKIERDLEAMKKVVDDRIKNHQCSSCTIIIIIYFMVFAIARKIGVFSD